MPLHPRQIRSIDPTGHRRFSDTYNLRSRILTDGEDVIIHPSRSFKFSFRDNITLIYDSTGSVIDETTIEYFNYLDGTSSFLGYCGTLSISEGLVIKDNVLVHVTASTDIDLTKDLSDCLIDEYIEDGMIDTPLFVFLQYKYKKSYPPPKASIALISDLNTYYVPFKENYMYLGHMTFDSVGKIEFANEFKYIGNNITLERNELDTYDVDLTANGGVLTSEGWFEDWVTAGA